tara:strand:+ start:679 stop:1362 length:684 start_codon:yes stop_codon:yes gene_type:complete
MTEKLDHIKALCKVQKILKHASKSEKGAFGKYADLATVYETIRKPLTEQGFAYFHSMVTEQEGSEFVETLLMHETGGTFKTRLPVINKKGDMQGLGSAITYAKRYGISMIVGLAHEDDDNGKGAGTGNVNPSGNNNKISTLVIKTREGEGKAKSLEGAVMQLNSVLKAQIGKYKGKELRETGEFMRKENAEILDALKNNKLWISNGSNERWNQIDKKLTEMENAKDE